MFSIIPLAEKQPLSTKMLSSRMRVSVVEVVISKWVIQPIITKGSCCGRTVCTSMLRINSSIVSTPKIKKVVPLGGILPHALFQLGNIGG